MASRLTYPVSRNLLRTSQTNTRNLAAQVERFPEFLLQAPATQVSKLSNGLRVATESDHGETATIGVWVDAGSRFETDENNGVAHFLEHLLFKGTKNRSQRDLEIQVENIGAHLNAYTSREQTAYYAKVLKKDIPFAMELLGDILNNATLSEEAIKRERNVILREMEEISKMTEEVVFDYLHETAFQGTGLARTILGPTQNILSITRDHIQDYIDKFYVAPRMVISAAGGVDHKMITELAEKHFGSRPSAPKGGVIPEHPSHFTGSDVRYREDTLPLAHVVVAYQGAPWLSPDSVSLQVLQTLLGCWDRFTGGGKNMSSKLAQIVAKEELAHSFMSFNTMYKDTGLFGVYSVAEPNTLNDLSHYLMENFVRLCHEVTDEEVHRAKNQLKANLLSMLDGTTARAEDIGRQMIVYGRRITPAELFARIDAVDTQNVKDTAFKYINDQELAIASMGPLHELPDYNFFRTRTYWLRF